MDENKKKNQGGSDTYAMKAAIETIDNNILELVNQRLVIAKKIGGQTQDNVKPFSTTEWETRNVDRIGARNNGPLDKKNLENIFTDIISASREIQRPQRITYLGPEATFTHIAAMKHFGRAAGFFPQHGIRDIFLEVEKGAFDYGVVPVENSIEGSVNYTLDLFFDSDLKICAEHYLNISHDLLSRTGVLDNIKVVYSHPQPFGQCRGWLRQNLPGAVLKECSSTSAAAQQASRLPAAAAIASSEAARLYNLKVVESKIEDYSKNITRFLIIGRDETHKSGRDRTSIMFAAPHEPGALYKVLGPIAEAGLNMLKLESRPSKHENWSYFFFVDLEGHIEDETVRITVEKIRKICLFVKIMGSYPLDLKQ